MSRQSAFALLILAVLVGFALRLYRVGDAPFRGDEAFAADYWAGQPLAVTFASIATIEPHPPLTYVFFRAWALAVGINEFTLRLLPALLNLLGIPALYAIGCRLGERRLGLLAAFLWALSPYEIWHSQDARNYAMWAGLSAVSAWLAVRVVDEGRRSDWMAYGLAAVVSAFVFYAELFTLAALNLYVTVVRWKRWGFLRRWFALQGAIALSVAVVFWLLQSRLFASGGYGGTFGSAGMEDWWTFLPTLVWGDTLPVGFVAWVWPVQLFVLVAGLVTAWIGDKRQGLFLVGLGVVPLLLLVVVAQRADIFNPRYILSAAPAYQLMFAALVLYIYGCLRRAAFGRLLSTLLVAGWLLVGGFSLYNHYFVSDYAKSQDWPALARYLRENVAPDDLVIQTSTDAAFGYYYDAPAADIGLPANPQQSIDDIAAELAASRERYRSIWVVGRTFADWPNAGAVEQWLQGNMQQVRSTATSGLPIRQFMPWEVGDDETEFTPLATFAGVAELVGVRVFNQPEPTGEMTLWLYWRPIGATEKPFKIFAHLVGAMNPSTGTVLWTQDDQYPQEARISTATWSRGKVYRDVYMLPLASVPPGDYSLEVGFYDPETNQRIPVGGSDSYVVQQIRLR